MGHGHHGPWIVLQGSFEPGHRFGIEVVGGLVEEQQVGARQEEAAERHPAPFTAGEGGDVGVGRREPQGVHGDLQLAVEIPCAGGVDAVLELSLFGEQLVEVGVRLSHGRAHLVEADQETLDLGHPVGDVAGHVLVRVELRLLWQKPDREPGREAGFAGEAVIGPSHDLQQG